MFVWAYRIVTVLFGKFTKADLRDNLELPPADVGHSDREQSLRLPPLCRVRSFENAPSILVEKSNPPDAAAFVDSHAPFLSTLRQPQRGF